MAEECRMPKGTDTTYVNKLHSEFENHSSYLRGEDRRNWGLQFGIKHYAGDVIYKVDGFLDKNKDAQQDQLFELMGESNNIFVKDLVKFQDLYTITSSRYWSLQRSNSTQSSTNASKGRPTVADAFRFQLTALVELLHSTNPWYVRCIKPNMQKVSDCYDNDQVLTQLQYLGMLDIIRIRREGYPIHFTFDDFVQRYKCLVMHSSELGKTSSETCLTILKKLYMPEKEWQIGKSRVFLRASVHEPLEELRKTVINTMAVRIQARWKGHAALSEYQKARRSAITVQRYFRGHRQKLAFLRKKRASITIQSFVRGMFAREVAAAMRQMKKVEEDERKREQEEKQVQLAAEQNERLANLHDAMKSSLEPSPSPSVSSITETGSYKAGKREIDQSIM